MELCKYLSPTRSPAVDAGQASPRRQEVLGEPLLEPVESPLQPKHHASSPRPAEDGVGYGALERGSDDDLALDRPRTNYVRGNARMGAWALLVFGGWLWTRAVCLVAHLPDDCVRESAAITTMRDIQQLLIFAFVQAWFSEITEVRRFDYVFSKGRLWFFALYFTSILAFGGISSIPALESSLSSGSRLSPVQALVYVLLGLLVVGVFAFHFIWAWKVLPTRNFLTYTGSRAAVLLFYVTYGLLAASEHDSFHMHHYFLAWAASLFAQFQHPVSLALLAIASGIFTQGLGAYHADSLFSKPQSPFVIGDDDDSS